MSTASRWPGWIRAIKKRSTCSRRAGWSKHSIPFSPPLFSGRIFDHPAHRGDIVVFKLPRDHKVDYIKRVIGLPGDRIQMKQGLLYLNDKKVPREPLPSIKEDIGDGYVRDVARYRETLPGGKTYITNLRLSEVGIESQVGKGTRVVVRLKSRAQGTGARDQGSENLQQAS